jgi:hypothetical protein
MLEKIKALAKNNLGLIAIIIFYLCFVFYRFCAQGLINWDEAYFVIVAETFSNLFKTGFFHPGELLNSAYYRELIANYGNIYTAARPSYIIPAALIGLIIPGEFCTRVISLLSGLLAIIYFYRLLGFYPLGKKIKLAATFLLTASPLFLAYSRLGLSQIFSGALFIAASYYLLDFNREEKNSSLKKTGLALALLLMSHYNTLIIVACLFTASIYIIFQKKKPVKDYFIFLVFFLIIPAAWEVITRAGTWIANLKGLLNQGIALPIFPYSKEILEQFTRNGTQPISDPGLMLYYLRLMISPEGLIFFGLFLIGLIVFAKNLKKINYIVILIPPLLHLLIFSFSGMKFTRNLITVLPALYIFSALGLNAIAGYLKPRLKDRHRNIFLIIFCLAVITLNSGQYNNLLNIKTNFKEMAEFIKNNYPEEKIMIFSSSAPVWRAYLPGYRSETAQEIKLWRQKYPDKKFIFIADYFKTISGDEKYLKNFSAKPLKEWRTNIFSAQPIILDFVYQSEEKNKKMFAENEKSSPNVIYELSPR